MAKYRAGIIACGLIARAHARGWESAPEVELAAEADSDPQALKDMGEQHGVGPEHRYTDYRQMLDREGLDIVSVCSWHPQHAEMVVAAAAREPSVILCEKPMAVNLQEADAMIVACRRNGVKLAIAHQRRFYSGWIEARELVARGTIGEPLKLWSSGLEGLLNSGTHAIDCMRFLLGDPQTAWVMGNVERKTDRYERAIRIADACAGIIGFQDGAEGTIENEMNITPRGQINCFMVGSQGMLDIKENDVRLFSAQSGGWRPLENVQNDPSCDQAQGIVDWLEGKVEDYRGEAQQGRAVVEIMMAVFESARCHEVVRMPLQTRLSPLDLMVESGQLPVERPGRYDIRSFLVRGEGMSWV